MSVSVAQYRLLKEIEKDPGGRITDWATRLEITTSAVWLTARRLVRDGYLRQVPLGKRSSRFVLTDRLGCCPHCLRPVVREVRCEPNKLRRLTLEQLEIIRTSKATNQSLAKRFGCSASHVNKLRKRGSA